ncbi:probable ubiquitin-conjugating enzyme E2 24 [Diospyros lotus]|uniref:probable ubiquitin-conjugating enzyme E2 24 n=1 Tax=Diospyros lotus TaxID=55363 RepID=UPI00224C7DE6|nr:probable ubiquitin-conjugating enzyme E2 24 [Diospyros lotus]XP_052202119.1 probable ubiquitin-conjugating enzyme E2 24 [Diospyros lotus]
MDFFSDIDSFSESSSSEEQDDMEILYGGQACSILSSLEETIGKIDDFLSFERGFMHGDVVCPANDPSGQMGRIVNINMFLDMENLHGKLIKDVNSRKIQKIRSISVGDYVVHGPWLGKVDKVDDCITILFDDGTKSELTTMGSEKIIPLPSDLIEDSQYPYYPGQRVRVELSTISKSAKWLCATWKKKHDEGTICAVEAGMVYVDWLACAMVGCERVPAPPCLQDSKKLTMVPCFSHANWHLGEWCILPATNFNGVKEQIMEKSTCDLVKGCKQPEEVFQRRISPEFQEIFVILKTKTKVDVLWQNGCHSMGLDSESLCPVNFIDAHDFWPGQFVMEKSTCDESHIPSSQRWGVVKGVDAKERTVRVQWKSPPVNKAFDFAGQQTETVSAYELVEHPDYSYCLGDVVFQLEKNHLVHKVDEMVYGTSMLTETEVGGEADLKAKNYGGEQNVSPNNGYLSCIGIVMGLKDGEVEVKWASGDTTKVAPYEIFQMDKHEDSPPSTPILQWEYDQLTEEMNEHEKQSLCPEAKVCSSLSLPRAAIEIFTCIVGSLFGSLGSTSLSGTCSLTPEEGLDLVSNSKPDVLESSNFCTEGSAMILDGLQTFQETNFEQQVKEIQEEKAPLLSSGVKHQEPFKQFDIVTGCLDHHFVDSSGKGLMLSQVKRGWLRKVQQEWSILEKDLPETIYVRAYEERMDLLRAAIVGVPGTPYHDGVFFFDIFLPPEYPQEPPLVHYNSGGLRINPNLYESGKVCLSLLNTWTGTETEVWNPISSTILQVLLSLQALVLNEKPYFNEAGYDKQMGRPEGEKNSVSYNENAFLVSCKLMLYILRKPPTHFETFVAAHFGQCAKYLLLACKAYMEGAPVGHAFGCSKSEQENEQGSSTGFKIMLSKLFPKLVEAFSQKGIDCNLYADSGI